MYRTTILPRLLPAALLALVSACDSPTGGGAAGPVAVKMSVAAPQGAASSGIRAAAAAAGGLSVTGSNGTLVIDELRLVVAEFELDGDDDVNACEDSGGGDDCDDFDAGPVFVNVPLDGAQVTVTSGDLPDGTYRRMEFEVEDLDDDEENAAERARIEQVRQQILAQFPDWPRDASMLVSGTFVPAGGGAARPFRVFVEAEIEVRLALNPPLVVSGASTSRTVSVTLDPAAVFRSGAQVLDLSQFNGRTPELELKVRDGFRGGSSGSDDD